ncbi:MAG: trigger factor [Clostridiales bacterium]|jgi:trigger factor|nr:trigger factor [Clostridiales bacterium]
MSLKLEKLENSVVKFPLEISAEEFTKARKRAYNKEGKKFNIPGFRKGKAPQKIIEQYYGEAVFYDEAINSVFPDIYEKALDELKIEPVAQPDVDVQDINGDSGVKLEVKVTIKPEAKLGKYKGIEIKKHEHKVTDDDINHELEHKREQGARIINKEEGAIESGDAANIDFEGFVDGVAFEGGKDEGYTLKIGSNTFIPGFEDQLIGKKVGDECDVKVTFPKEYHAEDLAGKDAIFKVKVNSIEGQILPELDDEFAKDVSEFDTLAELKADIKKHLEEHAAEHAKIEAEDELIEKIVEGMEVEIPQAMIDNEIQNRIQNFSQQLQQQGMSIEQYIQFTGATVDSLKEMHKEPATKQVKANLAIDAVIKAEGISATDEEIAAEYKTLAEKYNTEEKMLRQFFGEDSIKHDLTVRKAIEFLMSEAKIK